MASTRSSNTLQRSRISEFEIFIGSLRSKFEENLKQKSFKSEHKKPRMNTNNQEPFLALVRAGLWEKDVDLREYGSKDFDEILRLAEEQNVIGLVTAGIEHIQDVKVPQQYTLQFVGQSLQIEQQNQSMNNFISVLVDKMCKVDIYTLLVKGQGIAQCYEKPLWRASGDVDLLLNDSNYEKAKGFLLPLSSGHKPDERYSKHLGMNIDQWYVEIHGTLRTGLSGRIDRVVDEVQRSVFYGGEVRSWMNGKTTVFLPSPDNDVFFVFTHFIKHFYKEGMNLRQICDWCRLLWTYKDTLNYGLLELRIKKAGLMKVWRAFASLAVEYLGMPIEAMPFYDSRFKGKGSKLIEFILIGYTGNKIKYTWGVARIFPVKTICYLPSIFLNVNCLKIKERILGCL